MLYSNPPSRHGQPPGHAPVVNRSFDNDSDDYDYEDGDDWDDADSEGEDPDDDDTIEMELTPEQMRVLAEAAESWAGDVAPSSWPIAPSRQLTQGEPVVPAAPVAARVADPAEAPIAEPRVGPVVSKAPEVVITVDLCPTPTRVGSPATLLASSSIHSCAPIVIEHAPLKLEPAKAAAPVPPRPRWLHSQLRGALIAGVVAIAAFLSTLAYVAVTKARPADMPVFVTARHLPRETAPPPAPVMEAIPVRYANPFDATEVFEFPPGTSQTEAHDAVATLLLQRGQERLIHVEAAQHRANRSAHDRVRRSSTRLARRD